ncbi:MAG: hypothetical protein FWC23_08525 [Chitinispirillia bacterium]|nr:hypothetical protein [Chitinispirillia bacterium]MCL2269212.1 hypothetical protein [Chitinispirillia bacterium]
MNSADVNPRYSEIKRTHEAERAERVERHEKERKEREKFLSLVMEDTELMAGFLEEEKLEWLGVAKKALDDMQKSLSPQGRIAARESNKSALEALLTIISLEEKLKAK